jgi:hypothetical protein
MRMAALIASILVVGVGIPARAGRVGPNLKNALISAGPDELIPIVVMMETYPAREELMAEIRGLNREWRATAPTES